MSPVTAAPSQYYTFFQTTLKRSMTSASQTTGIVLDPVLDNNGNPITFTSFELILTFLQGSKKELISAGGFTQDTQGNITLTDVRRDLAWDGNSFTAGSNPIKFTAKATVKLSLTAHSLNGLAFKNGVNTWTAKNTFDGGIQPPIFANNTARDAAFPAPWNGLTVVSGVQLQAYFNSTWNVLGTATVFSATESVEGTVELATLAEHDPSTTGPRVVQARNTRKTSTGAAEGQVVALNASARVDASLLPNIPVTNLNSGTGATSSTFWRGDGTWATPATSTQVALLQTTRSTTAASGTVSIAHGLGTVPNLVKAEMRVRGAGVSNTDIGAYSSSGQSNGTINQCVVIFENNNGGTTFAVENDSTRAIVYVEDSGAYPSSITDGQTATITFDATNVNLNWTLTGAPTAATMYIMLTVFKF